MWTGKGERVSRDELQAEQTYISGLYERLDALTARTEQRLAATIRQHSDTPTGLTERDLMVARHTEQLQRFRAASHGLCFGRIDLAEGEQRYIGRLGLFDEEDDHRPLLIDWRAPAARPFYLATGADPQGVWRRRHIRLRDRTVVGIQDDLLDLTAADRADRPSLSGESALLAALTARRTGRMADIVATIQAEQDRVIRCDHDGVLVVEGGPGTGKTAVALHRAAYLLYTHREQLASRGVLVVGPNPTFLRYIDQVLPSLGETSVVLSTIGDLFPGIRARRVESWRTTEVKGRPEMVDVMAAAVRQRQLVPEQPWPVELSDQHAGLGYQTETLHVTPELAAQAREQARRSKLPHNQAQEVFRRALIDGLARQLAERLGHDPWADDPLGGDDAPGAGALLLSEGDIARIASELATDPAVARAVAQLWPLLTPEQLLTDLYASRDRLAAAAPELSDADREALYRLPGGGWSPADVPLLDEAAELLGEDSRELRARQEAARRLRERQLEYAQGVLDIAAGSGSIDNEDELDPEILSAVDILDASALAERQQWREVRSIAELAAADRRWAFGHVIVDEAQELSPMAWRMLMRRCPSRSMTVVGDLAQTGDPAGTSSWEGVLAPYVGDRWRRERLTVNYRTPESIMKVATAALASRAPDAVATVPRSIRDGEVPPRRRQVPAAELADRLPELVAAEAATVTGGRLAVIVPEADLERLAAAIATRVPDLGVGSDPEALDRPVGVLPVNRVKGLEFDAVVVVRPEALLVDSPRGANDLYVALTRATTRLLVVHCAPPPAWLAELPEATDPVDVAVP